jgi:hypothetical protein
VQRLIIEPVQVVVLVSSLYTVKAFSFEVVCIYAQNYDVNWCCTTHVRTPTIYPTYLSRVNGTSQVLLLCVYNNVKYLSRGEGTPGQEENAKKKECEC